MNSKKYNLLAAVSIVVANMVGTGVFTSLGFQLFELTQVSSIVLLWLLGGIIALLGSFCYCELSSTFPRSGGEYHFLGLAFNQSIGFLSGWTSAILGFAAPIAAAAYAFSKYFSESFHYNGSPVLVAIFLIVVITTIQMIKFNVGQSFQILFTIGKVLLLIVFIISGLYYSNQQELPHEIINNNGFFSEMALPAFWVSLIFVSYSYSGWNATSYIIDDIENPKKNVTRSILFGTVFITVIYVLINYVFMISAPVAEMKGKVDVAFVSATYIYGLTGAKIVSGMICFFLISSISSMIIVGPRVIKLVSSDFSQLSFFEKVNNSNIPVRAIFLQSFISILLLVTSSFEFIVTSMGFILSVFTSLTAISVIVLRKKYPDVKREVAVPFYPITPILFFVFNIFIIFYLILNKPMEVISSFGFLLVGLILYHFVSRKNKNMRTKAVFILPIAFCYLTSCNQGTEKQKTTISKAAEQKVIVQDAFTNEEDNEDGNLIFDNNAFLLSALDTTKASKDIIDSIKNKINNSLKIKNETIINPIGKWMSEEHINDLLNQPYCVFYPFSGPDFEFANAFYPEAEKYIFCGLEFACSDSSYVFQDSLSPLSFLTSMEKYCYYSNKYGFFRTLDMEKQFKERGVVDLLSVFIKRSGGTIKNIKPMFWSVNEGRFIDVDESHVANSCYINFINSKGKKSKLYYFQKDLSNDGIASDTTWFKWIDHQSKGKKLVTLTKSASYLMHSSYFTDIRDFLIKKSSLHIQDDTGIPFSELKKLDKKVDYYGKYSKVIPVFNKFIQPEMKMLYQNNASIRALPFNIGYNLKFNETNLQVIH
jgi:APA family basic amino acid/polyamine antiporter